MASGRISRKSFAPFQHNLKKKIFLAAFNSVFMWPEARKNIPTCFSLPRDHRLNAMLEKKLRHCDNAVAKLFCGNRNAASEPYTSREACGGLPT